MKRIVFSGIFLLIVVAAFFSCKKEDLYGKSRREELKELEAYIAENYPDIKPKPSGLYFIETQEGAGDTIKVLDRVHIYYATYALSTDSLNNLILILIDESVQYSTDGYMYEPFEVIVGSGGAIQGLEEGLRYMQPGSQARLVINSGLAYGDGRRNSPVPGFTTLVMDVDVHKVFPYDIPED